MNVCPDGTNWRDETEILLGMFWMCTQKRNSQGTCYFRGDGNYFSPLSAFSSRALFGNSRYLFKSIL